MSIASQTDHRGFIRLTLAGPWPSSEEVLRVYKSLSDIRVARRLLIDISRATGPLPMFPDIRELVSGFDIESAAARTRRRAVLVSSDVQFGVARTFQAILPGEMEVFRDEGAALTWLLADTPAA
jgi:hypothetical protein